MQRDGRLPPESQDSAAQSARRNFLGSGAHLSLCARALPTSCPPSALTLFREVKIGRGSYNQDHAARKRGPARHPPASGQRILSNLHAIVSNPRRRLAPFSQESPCFMLRADASRCERWGDQQGDTRTRGPKSLLRKDLRGHEYSSPPLKTTPISTSNRTLNRLAKPQVIHNLSGASISSETAPKRNGNNGPTTSDRLAVDTMANRSKPGSSLNSHRLSQ